MANLTTIEVLRIPGTLFPRGSYDENASYKFLNFVESGGNGYVCLQPCTGIPVTNTAYWFKFVFRGEKGDAFTYADLTAEQKAELVRDATAAAQAAASSAQSAADDAAAALQKFNTIKAAIDALDPTSTEGSIQTLAAKQGLLESEVDALGQNINQIKDIYDYKPHISGVIKCKNSTLAYNSTSLGLESGKTYRISVSTSNTISAGSIFFYLRKVAANNTPNIRVINDTQTHYLLLSPSIQSDNVLFTPSSSEYQYLAIYHANDARITLDITFVIEEVTLYSITDKVKTLEDSLYIETLTSDNGGIVWEQGGINSTSGYDEDNTKAIRTLPIYLNGDSTSFVYRGSISGFSGAIAVYDEDNVFRQWTGNVSLISSFPNGYVRLVYYGSKAILPSSGNISGATLIRKKKFFERLSFVENIVTKSYSNPVLRADFPDPTVWNGEDGYLYAFATGVTDTKTMYRSVDLINWENTFDSPFTSVVASEVKTALNHTSFWAPCVYKVNGSQWNMYLSSPNGNRIAALTSSNPIKGYRFVRYLTATFPNFIDADVAMEKDGNLYMFAGAAAKMYRCMLTSDGLNVAEGSTWVHVAGLSTGDAGNSSRVKTFEGAYLYRRQGYWYLFCSSGLFDGNNYSLRVVRSQTLDGIFVDKEGNLATEGYAEYVIQSNSVLWGPGHNAQIFVDSDNKTWILYHCHWKGFNYTSTRGMCLDEILWDEDGWPYILNGTPSTNSVAPRYIRG